MQKKKRTSKGAMTVSLVILGILILSACAPAAIPTQDVALIQTQAAQTVVADMALNEPASMDADSASVTPTMAPPPGPTPDPNIPVAVVPTPAAGEPAAVAKYNTAIMSGPGTNYVLYAAFLGGSTAKVVGKNDSGTWWAISVPVAYGGTGWVDSAWVSVSNADGVAVLPTPPVPPTVEMVPPEPTDPQATALANVYIRNGPGTSYPAYGIVPAGATGRVLGKSVDSLWWVVRLDPTKVGAGYGWVAIEYTSSQNTENVQTIETPPTTTTAPPPPPPSSVPTATAVDYVNVRSGPGTNYQVLFVAPAGASGEVTGKSADSAWWQVKISTQFSPDGFGWVSADWVTTSNTGSIPVVAAPSAPPPVASTPPPPGSGGVGCALVSQSPADGTSITIGTPFDTTWVIQNTGSTKWDMNEYDVRFIGAYENNYLHTGPDVYDLPVTVEPGSTINITVSMMAPFGPGPAGEAWQIAFGDQSVCQFWVYIVVP